MYDYAGTGGFGLDLQDLCLTLVTDSHVVRGVLKTQQRRLTDVLNNAEHDFLVVGEASVEEFGSREQPSRADFAQVNLDTLLFAVADREIEPKPELRLQKLQEQALIIVPPFRIIGRLHVLPGRELREALGELTGKFIPLTDAAYWSERYGEPKTPAPMVAFNRARAQILASHHEADPWAGLSS